MHSVIGYNEGFNISFQQGISIHCNSNISLKDRLSLSQGVGLACDIDQLRTHYLEDALIPILPWREPTTFELNILNAQRTTHKTDYNHIGLLKIPDESCENLERLGLHDIQDVNGLHTLLKHPEYKDAIYQILIYLTPYLIDTHNLDIMPIRFKTSNSLTTTRSNENSKFVGLHVDSVENLPAIQAGNARRRLCLNLGKEERYLLFINLTLAQCFSLLNMVPPVGHVEYNIGGSIAYEFLRRYPNYPVIKLRINPKEAYIAPTENMIHDGYTIGKETLDLVLEIHGNLRIIGEG